ncbi:MAG: hypothetical protein Q8N62_08065 [Candidatus Omnitrophota bacterium]|nr:hypothetical protein [Candidatus Omnitrophota bacterium]
MRKKKGQSILEYVIVLTVIIVAVAVAAKTFIAQGVNKGLEDAKKTIEYATGQLPK